MIKRIGTLCSLLLLAGCLGLGSGYNANTYSEAAYGLDKGGAEYCQAIAAENSKIEERLGNVEVLGRVQRGFVTLGTIGLGFLAAGPFGALGAMGVKAVGNIDIDTLPEEKRRDLLWLAREIHC